MQDYPVIRTLKIMSIIYGLSDDEIIEVLKEVELLADKDKACV